MKYRTFFFVTNPFAKVQKVSLLTFKFLAMEKRNFIFRITILTMVGLCFLQCQKDELVVNDSFESVVWTELTDSEFDLLGVAQNGELVAIETRADKNVPSKLFYQNGNKMEFILWLNEEGYPSEAYVNGFHLVYRNITENSVDVGIVSNDGETEIVKGLEYDFVALIDIIEENSLKSAQADWGKIIKWSGHALNAGMCIASVTGTVASFGALAPVGVLTCSSFILGMASEAAAALIDNENFDNALLAYSGQGGFTSIGDVLVLTGNLVSSANEDKQRNSQRLNDTKNRLEDKTDGKGITFGEFGITVEAYKDQSNWDEIVQDIFGSDYRVTDWQDLEEYHNNGGDLLELFDELGLTEYGNSAFVTRGGKRNYSSTRYYFASRHEHSRPSNYLAHENINNYLISLGSWYTTKPVMVKKVN